ncbi:MAG: hypothetical protein AAFZ15_28635 [Bacteroidota bacterium]
MKTNTEIAVQFGQSLDEDNFVATAKLLSPTCIYVIGEKRLNGPSEIVGSYEQNMIEGRKKLDKLEWGKSMAEKINEQEYLIHFTDYLTHKGLSYTHRCTQKIRIELGVISHIFHIENKEEQKKLNDFYLKVGILKT